MYLFFSFFLHSNPLSVLDIFSCLFPAFFFFFLYMTSQIATTGLIARIVYSCEGDNPEITETNRNRAGCLHV